MLSPAALEGTWEVDGTSESTLYRHGHMGAMRSPQAASCWAQGGQRPCSSLRLQLPLGASLGGASGPFPEPSVEGRALVLFSALPPHPYPMHHRELSPQNLSKLSVNRIFTPFVQCSENRK